MMTKENCPVGVLCDGYVRDEQGHHIYLWELVSGEQVWASAPTLSELSRDPRLTELPRQRGIVARLLREETERTVQWACTPDRRVYGPGYTRSECESRHASYLRSGCSRASSSAYHYVSSEPA